MKFLIFWVLGITTLMAAGCAGLSGNGKSEMEFSGRASQQLIVGADLTNNYVPYLIGKRVGLVVNQSSTIDGEPSVEALLAMGVQVRKIFGPEHGFRGNASNGSHVGDEIDAKTGLPIVSLYGKKPKPTKEDLADLDLLIFDIQDMGVRFYTKTITLRDVMEACAENGKELMILDRPNPHGYLIDGPILDMELKSGIGQFPVPIAHGMTVGEFALMINGEGWLKDNLKCNLNVIKMENYHHDLPYELPIFPSPNLNTPQSVMLYPSTCLFEGTILNHGRGTYMPFTVLGAPALKGIYEFSYMPISIPGMSETPLHQGEICYGLDLRNFDVEPLRQKRQINLSWLIELYQAYPDKEKFFDSKQSKQIGSIDKLSGTWEFKKQIISGMSEAEIRKTWEPGLAAYKTMRQKYLLYP